MFFAASPIFSPQKIRRGIAAQACRLLWQEAEQSNHSLWASPNDRELCENFQAKSWKDLSEKDLQIIEMLMLKYGDQPNPADLADDRILN